MRNLDDVLKRVIDDAFEETEKMAAKRLEDIELRGRLGAVCEMLERKMRISSADKRSVQVVSGRRVVRESYATTHSIAAKLTEVTWVKRWKVEGVLSERA